MLPLYIVLYLISVAVLGWRPVLLFAFILIGSAGSLGVAVIQENKKYS
jgi:hypothetical protein